LSGGLRVDNLKGWIVFIASFEVNFNLSRLLRTGSLDFKGLAITKSFQVKRRLAVG
jgi:hypothetical protein